MNRTIKDKIRDHFFDLRESLNRSPELRDDVLSALRLATSVNSSALDLVDLDPIFLYPALQKDYGRKWEKVSERYQQAMIEVQGYCRMTDYIEEAALSRRALTIPFLMKLHRLVFENTQYSLAGRLRISDHEQIPLLRKPPHHARISELTEQHLTWLGDRLRILGEVDHNSFYQFFNVAAEAHYRFAEVCLFEEGNGRMARAISDYVFLYCGSFYEVIRYEDRQAYFNALRQSSIISLSPLIDFLVESFARTLDQVDGMVRLASVSQTSNCRQA